MDENELCERFSADLDLDIEARFYITMPYNTDDSDSEYIKSITQFPSDDSENEIPAKRVAKDVNIEVQDSSADRTIFKVNKHENEEKPHKTHKLKKKREDKKKKELFKKAESPKLKEYFKIAARTVTLVNNETLNASCFTTPTKYKAFTTPEANESNNSESDNKSLQALRKHWTLVNNETLNASSFKTPTRYKAFTTPEANKSNNSESDDESLQALRKHWTLVNNETLNASCFKTPTKYKAFTTPEANESNNVSDDESLQALRKHRKLISCNNNSTSSTFTKKDAELYSTYPVNIYPNNWETMVRPPSNLNKTYPPLEASPDCSTNRFRNQKRSRWSSYDSQKKSGWSSNDSSTDSSSIRSMNPSMTMLPCYKNYQLLGDSQLVRFSEQLLNARRYITYTEDRCRRIGYCVSGQKIEGLRQRLSRKEFPLSDKVIMLIGTNDFVYSTKLESMYESYEAILKILAESSVSKIVLITVPPVPKLSQNTGYLNKFKNFNRFIRRHNEEGRIVVIDLASLFVDLDYKINLQYFEETFSNSNKPDLIHLNRDGFKLLQAVLDINYFDKIPFNNR